MTQTEQTQTAQDALQHLRALRNEMREVRAQLDEHQTRIEAAGLAGELDPLDLAAADELSDRLDTLHTQMIALQMTPALQGDPAPMTQAMINHEREMGQAADTDNRATRHAAMRMTRLPQLRTRKHRPTQAGVRAAIVQIGREDLLA